MNIEDLTINVLGKGAYLPDQSHPHKQHFVFSYEMRIENWGINSIRILGRKWTITDAEGKQQRITGVGVVGRQPIIPVGEVLTYVSGVVLATPVGSMEGIYEVIDSEGSIFDLKIPAFSLAQPGVLH